ncbi:hypothetical protein DL762_009097 [Monosporascus cannonballus]|uniref:Uncharacterized protein n=1 Tax=Monosporascus cannonballus TaxID=155416 RepID=A0ABY0GUB4_9PEZI|nr:hypothetical protein DL762_009097 [Monosporascus cannonballus]RYP00895.1 hypothetical protein DL763_000525 [Monosporascus cannonballus]
MPFDFKAYDAKCNGLTPEELQREWQHYTRLISGASTSTAVSGIAMPFTMGVSTIGVAMAAPAIHNARKKREIIEKHLQKHGTTHVTRKRDVVGSMAVSGTIGIVTLGVGTAGADAVATAGAEHGISAVVENETAIKIVTHAALDGVGMGIEHAHTSNLKKKDAVKAFQAAGVFQAVENAKAAEAGYSIQPYNPQNFAAGSSTAQLSSLPPPPPYTPGTQQPPSYCITPSHVYASGPKSVGTYTQDPHDSRYVDPAYTGQHLSQPYDPNRAQFQQNTPAEGTTTSGTPSMQGVLEPNFPAQTNPQGPQANYSMLYASSGPLTPIQQPSQVQNDQPQQQPQQYTIVDSQTARELPSGQNPSSVEIYDMEAMAESLPPPGTDSISLCKQQRSDSIVRRPLAKQQPQEPQNHSLLSSSRPPQHDCSSQSQTVSHDTEIPPPPINPAGTQSQADLQQELQPSSNYQADRAALLCSPQHSQASGLSQYIAQSPPQQCPSPPIRGIQFDISSLCGPDIGAPLTVTTQTTAPNYGEHTTAPSLITQEQPCREVSGPTGHENPKATHDNAPKPVHQQHIDYIQQQQTGMFEENSDGRWQPAPQRYSSHVKQQYMGMSQGRQHIYPQTSHQQHPSYIQQQETGATQGGYRNCAQPHHQHHPGYIQQQQQQTAMCQGVTGHQPQRLADPTQRYSLQPGLYPSPLPTPSPQFTPTVSQGVPYFPPPPRQPQEAYSPAPFTSPPPPSPRNLIQRKPVQPSTVTHVQYPPVSIPEPYRPVEIPASHHRGPPFAQQQCQLVNPLNSNPQQPSSQIHPQMSGFPRSPLTPPDSPPPTVQYTGSGYFPAVTNHQYQNMYPTYQQ